MIGTVNAMLLFSWGNWPKVYEFNRRPGRSLIEPFKRRIAELAADLGEPRRETRIAWYPHLEEAACWDRDSKTVVLVREPEGRCGARIVLWCVAETERAELVEAARTRAARADHLEQEFRRCVGVMSEVGRNKFLRRRVLTDDLAAAPVRADALLARLLTDPDAIARHLASDLTLALGGVRALPRVVPLFDDPEPWVRQAVIESMAGYGDESVVDALLRKLRTDADPGVRGEAAYALGHVGSPGAIPGLIHALDHDKEFNDLGHSPSSISATALDNLLGTHQTRIHHGDGLCSMAPWKADHDLLKRVARELYERWQAGGSS
ncbi:MAG TPA: HEAT repeat domain-containing protein [Urbifossiella sp.]|nr:HEAT repeat domain-containing protein [Urbifossiella sp.]